MNLFYGKAKQKNTTKDTMLRLREALDMLDKRVTHLQTKADNEMKIAKANATKNKKVAILALKRKKMHEANIEKMDSARLNIESQMITLENANVNLEIMNAMSAAAETMKNTHKELDIDKVDSTMDNIRDQMELGAEISEAISRPVNGSDEIDEDELLEELEELEQEELDAKMLSPSSPVILAPNVPVDKPIVTREESDEEAELRALQASMAS
ncbi:vacuolar-sorting protein SNF7 [Parasitella parasitica]|nr:vacuolar-sorting protein SNF7 [Parasitella parasitica]